MNLQEGTTLQNGQYRIIRPLGQGGFGITYLAEDTLLKRQVVIKEFFIGELCFREKETSQVTVLSEGGRKTVDHFRKKFFREAQIVAGLSHPHIITIHAVFEENNTAYYVMEYHPNGSLQDKLEKLGAPMAEADALRYIRQVADALAYIHGQEVAEEGTMKRRSLRHLDVKPGNIMLNKRGEAVLIDFGLVKVYDEEGNPLSTHSSTLNGFSPRFSPMEQVFADNKTVFTPATDIYALGATLYNLVEGTLPPTINALSDMEGNLLFSDTTSAPVRKAITQAMQLNAVKRPQTIAEFLKLLPQKVEKDPHAVYKKGLAEGVAFFQAGEYVKALSRFLVLQQLHPGHRAEIGEWMMKCTEKMNNPEPGGGETLRRDSVHPTPPKPTPTPTLWRKIGGGALLLALLVVLAFIFRPESCKGGEEKPVVDTLAVEVVDDDIQETAEDEAVIVEEERPTTSSAKVVDDYADKLSSGKKLYNSKNYQAAVSHFQEMLTAYPSHAEEVKDWLSDSRSALEKANYEQALVKGDQYYNSKNYAKALTHFTNMKEEYPTYYDALNNRIAKCQAAKENAEQAKKSSTNSTVASSGTKLYGHEYVDLGLSVKWATCNVGASSPSDYGSYFAWGETRQKTEYTIKNSVTYEKSFGDIGGNAQYDAARANWGGSWRLPTKDELIELKEKCKWTWTTQGGHNGYKVVGPSGKSIFLPAAGWRSGASLYLVGELGYYWSSSPDESRTQYACSLYFDCSYYGWDWGGRLSGHSVRPVLE